MTAKKFPLKNILLFLLFGTLCVFATWFQIPFGYKCTLNLSYIIIVLGALFFGGFISGISGALGMCLYYLLDNQGGAALIALAIALTITISITVVKWLIEEKKFDKTIFMFACGALLFGIAVLYSFILIRVGETYIVKGLEIPLKFYWTNIAFPCILGAMFILGAFFIKKLPEPIEKSLTRLCFVTLCVIVLASVFSVLIQLGDGTSFRSALCLGYNKYINELIYTFTVSVITANGLYWLFYYQRYLNQKLYEKNKEKQE